jgi:hypothetical protein
LLFCINVIQGQGILNRIPRGGGGSGGNDSLERRNNLEDSITIRYRYLDSTRNYTFDSSISDFNRRFPIPHTYHYLGNVGTAARPILFSPNTQVGFDPGFHAFDVYKWSLDKVRFFSTTRPYTELGYVLGSQTQQTIEIQHTQNFKPHWNIGLQYRLINSPGFFQNQRTNHNNYLFTSWYQSPNKRYNNFLVLLGNKLQSAESGGIRNVSYLDSSRFEERLSIPTKFGPVNNDFTRSPFGGGSSLVTGNTYGEFTALLRQQYDIGQKDSIVTDSTVIPLFYPRLRFEHSLRYSSNRYMFQDYAADTTFYLGYYNTKIDTGVKLGIDTLVLADRWKSISNDFSIYTFPDAKNLQQFLKLGVEFQILNGRFRTVSENSKSGSESFANVIAHGEYRNRTRNQKWDMLAFGRLHASGYNAGDYQAYVSLQRLISNRIGSLQVGFENSSRSPAFIQDERSGFYLDAPKSLNKENISHFFAAAINPALKLRLGADYYLIGNYLYYRDYYKVEQENALFNVLRLSAQKTFRLTRHLNWYAEAYLQQKTGNVDLNIPLLLTRHRFAFEGNFFRNLFLSTGLDIRYHTPFKADHYSPVIGQFTYQDTTTISNRPDIHAFFNFRIRSFQAYVRAENLNTLDYEDGFTFTRHNLSAPDYPYPGLVLRIGFYWSFVN